MIPKIPDGTVLGHGQTSMVVFNPSWWRIDRWIFWVWIRYGSRRSHGIASFSFMNGDHLERFDLPVYEEKR
jgi:hypothetical protein